MTIARTSPHLLIPIVMVLFQLSGGAPTPTARAQMSAEESTARLQPAEGLEATLWAAEPMLANPTAIDIDSRGRVWVAEGLNYRLTRRGNAAFSRVEGADAIKILEDTDGDGKADKVTVFADNIFPVPMGLAVEERYDENGEYLGCRVFVGNSPDLLVLEDTDGDDKADKRYPLLTGFGGLDSDHGVHGMMLGLDGKLYFTHGDGCCSVQPDNSERKQNFDVTDKSGRRVSTDQLGTILRVNRDGTEFEVVCDRLRNNYEVCQTAFGHLFSSDNDDDGRGGCRVVWAMDGSDNGYQTPGSPRHWGEDVAGTVPKLVGTGNGSPTGIMAYEGRLLPDAYFGGLFEADAGTRQINFFPLTREGAAFRTEYKVLLGCDDAWFRPVDVCASPDGSVFVADWYDSAVGGHAFADQTTGRIYRVAPKGHQPSVVQPDFATIPGLIEALQSPNVVTQDAARRSLIARGDEAADALLALIREGTAEAAARGVWTASASPSPKLNGIAAEILNRPADFRDGDPQFRELAIRILGRDCRENGTIEHQNPDAQKPPAALAHLDLLLPLADDPDAGVRRELILAIRNVPTPKIAEALRKLVANWDGQDRWYLEALGLALDDRESEFITSLMDPSLFGEPGDFADHLGNDQVALPPYFPTDRNEAYIPAGAPERPTSPLSRFLGLQWRLRRPEALPVLENVLPRLKGPELQRAGVDALRGMTDSVAADVAALVAERTDDPNHQRAVTAMLVDRLAGPWRPAADRPSVVRLIEECLNDPERRIQGIALAAASGDARHQAALEALATSPDEPDEMAVAAIEALGGFPSAPASVLEGLIEAVRGESDSNPRAEAAVRTLPKLGDAADSLWGIVTDQAFPSSLRREALRTAARLPGGAVRLVDLATEKKIPDDLKIEGATLLSAHADPKIRGAGEILLPLPKAAGGRSLPPVAELLKREGDPNQGERVFFRQSDNACGSCHRAQGQGTWLGPDLSTIGTKYGKDELLRSILDPSAAIGYSYRAVVVALADGRVVTGLPVEESPERLVLKTAEGERIAIAAGEIEERKSSDVSLMPDNLVQTMTDAELVDLLAYLESLRRPVSIIGQYQVVGPVAEPDDARALDPSARIDPGAAVDDGEGRSLAWRRVVANAEGLADIGPLSTGGPRRVAYAHAPIISATAQKGRLVLDSPVEAAVWFNGEPLNLSRDGEGGPLAAEIDLPEGVGSLLIRFEGGEKSAATALAATTIIAPREVAFSPEAAESSNPIENEKGTPTP